MDRKEEIKQELRECLNGPNNKRYGEMTEEEFKSHFSPGEYQALEEIRLNALADKILEHELNQNKMKTENIFYQHYRTGNVYRVVSRDILLENPTTEEWVPGVLYEEYLHIDKEKGTKIYVKDGKKFMRSKERFSHSFKPWEGEI